MLFTGISLAHALCLGCHQSRGDGTARAHHLGGTPSAWARHIDEPKGAASLALSDSRLRGTRRRNLVLGMALDMHFSGVGTLIPIYATPILHVRPLGSPEGFQR